jgi:hypothetical protein
MHKKARLDKQEKDFPDEKKKNGHCSMQQKHEQAHRPSV